MMWFPNVYSKQLVFIIFGEIKERRRGLTGVTALYWETTGGASNKRSRFRKYSTKQVQSKRHVFFVFSGINKR